MKLPLAGGATALLLAAVFSTPPEGPALSRARALLRREAFQSARIEAEAALAGARKENDAPAGIAALRLLGEIAEGRGESREAEARRQEALGLAREAGDPGAEAWLLVERAAGAWQRAEYDTAAAGLLSALEQFRARRDALGEGSALVLRGKIAFKKGQYTLAQADYSRALALFRRAKDPARETETILDLGLCALDQREYSRAIEFFRSVRDRARTAGDAFTEAEGVRHIAITWLFQEAPEEALSILRPYLEKARKSGDAGLWMRLLHIAANAKRAAGEHQAAIEDDARVLEFFEAEGNQRQAAWVHYRRMRSEAALGRLDEARSSVEKACSLWAAIGERRPLAFGLFEKGKLEVRLGQDEAARHTFRNALALQLEIDLPYRPLLLGELAFLEARAGNFGRAGELAGEAVAAAQSTDNGEMLWTALYRQSMVLRLAGHPEKALAALRAALARIEEMRSLVSGSDEARIGFLESKEAVFAEAVLLLVEQGKFTEALAVSERGRARALADFRGDRAASRPAGPIIEFPLLQAEAQDRRATFLEFTVGERGSAVIVLDPRGDVHGVPIEETADSLARAVESLRSALLGLRDARPLLKEFHRKLVAPVSARLPEDPASTVILVPQGPLFLLPFAALMDDQGRYLVERHTLATVPAIHTLRGFSERTLDRRAEALVVGPPPAAGQRSAGFIELEGAEEEARTVAGFFPGGQVHLLLGDEATEQKAREKIRGAGIVHFATHAVVRDDFPFDGFILLARGSATREEDDGRLRTREIAGLRLQADLVVLSACNSGVGRIRGEGVVGLSRAFLQAGAKSVLASLWRVADPVALPFMEHFHRELRSGKGKAAALRTAQLETLHLLNNRQLNGSGGEPFPPVPFYWAPFVLIGEAQ